MTDSRDRHGERARTVWLPVLLCALSTLSACDLWPSRRAITLRHDPETAVHKVPLPAAVPHPHPFDFAGPGQEGHIRPVMAAAHAAVDPPSTPDPTALSASDMRALDQSARQNGRVARILGPRAAFIDAEVATPDGKVDFGCCRAASATRSVRLTYYSYAANAAIDVTVKNGVVTDITRRERYQPPEGDEEVQAAIALGRQDARLGGRVSGLEGHALLMEPERGVLWNDAGYGHRVFWVTFERGQSGDPLFWAVVDLTDQRVLEAGEEPHR